MCPRGLWARGTIVALLAPGRKLLAQVAEVLDLLFEVFGQSTWHDILLFQRQRADRLCLRIPLAFGGHGLEEMELRKRAQSVRMLAVPGVPNLYERPDGRLCVWVCVRDQCQ